MTTDKELVENALIEELKRQNICQDKDIGRTKFKVLLGVDEGVISITHLAQAAIAAMGDASARKDEASSIDTVSLPSPASDIPSEISYIWTDEEKDNLYDAIQEVIARNDTELSFAGAFEGNGLFNALKPFLRTDSLDESETAEEIYDKLNKRAKIIGYELRKPEPVTVSLEKHHLEHVRESLRGAAIQCHIVLQDDQVRYITKATLDAAGVKYVD